MNGIVANTTRPQRLHSKIVRGLLVVGCCVLSVSLVGAVHTRPWPAAPATPAVAAAAVQAPAAVGASTIQEEIAEVASFRQSAAPRLSAGPRLSAVPLMNVGPAAGTELLQPLRRNAAAALAAPAVETAVASLSNQVQKTLSVPSAPARSAAPSLAGRPSVRKMWMEVTAYCPCKKCCGPRAQGITASGRPVSHNGGLFVAADTKVLKFHTKLLIPGYAAGQAVPVIDRGGAIKGNKLDVYFPTHQQAREWGRRWIEVTVLD